MNYSPHGAALANLIETISNSIETFNQLANLPPKLIAVHWVRYPRADEVEIIQIHYDFVVERTRFAGQISLNARQIYRLTPEHTRLVIAAFMRHLMLQVLRALNDSAAMGMPLDPHIAVPEAPDV